jgi:hypothetical protein
MLKAAAEIAGGVHALALELGVTESLMLRFMDGTHPLPDKLLLRAVDIILADRQERRSQSDRAGAASLGVAMQGPLPGGND